MDLKAECERSTRILQTNPGQIIRAASAGSFADIMVVASNVQSMQKLQTPEVVAMFCSHLDHNKCPSAKRLATHGSPAADSAKRALLSLQALGNFAPFFSDEDEDRKLLDPVEKNWPGIYRWMDLFYTLQSQRPENDVQRQGAFEMISYAMYAIAGYIGLKKAMQATPGAIRLATILWQREDEGSAARKLAIPMGSAALHRVLSGASKEALDEVVKSSGTDAERLATLALTRLNSAVKGAQALEPDVIHSYIDVVIALTRRDHPLRDALLRKGTVGLVTRAFVRLSRASLADLSVRDAVEACIGCTSNVIGCTDGVTWVQQALHEGLLLALVNISPSFRLLDGDVCTLVLALLSDRLPRYFVYRSVIVAASAALTKLDTQHLAKIARSPLKEPWLKLKHLTEERMSIKTEWSVMRKQVGYCDNCQKQGPKDTFKQCARCQTTMYCSKACQVLGWKKGHKAECDLKSLERTALQAETASRQDRVFMHHLAVRNARENIAALREIAARDHPGVPYAGLGVSCDYLQVPPAFGVFALENHTLERLADPTADRTLEARGLSLIAKARASEGQHTLVESHVSRGEMSTLIITISVRSLWEFDSEWEEEMNRLIDLSAENVGVPSAWAKELTD